MKSGLTVLGTVLHLLITSSLSLAGVARPNIIFIMVDDMGFNDVGFRGGDIRTPNIDALATHGIIFNRHYSQPTCSPSRTALMTGRYPMRSGMHGIPLPAGISRSLPLKEKLFPQYFSELGYKSHLVGKWHLGYETWDHMPTRRGFDTFFGYLNGFVGYYDGTHSQDGVTGRDFRRNETQVWQEIYGKYLTQVLTEEAVSIIHNHNDFGGLLLFLNHLAPHFGNMDFVREAPPTTPRNATERRIFAEMMRYVDDSIGEVMTALDVKGLLSNSIIAFISDNGAPTIDKIWNFSNHGSNWPLRGLKVSNHEGGVRTTAVIWSPFLPKSKITDQFFHISDWLPTLYTAAGGSIKELNNLDGLNQWGSLFSNSMGPRSEILVDMDEIYGTEALISGQWKIIRNFKPTNPKNFTDLYYGVDGRDAPYNPVDVENSVVGRILKKPEVGYQQVRDRATLSVECLDKDSAVSTDCHTKYCLFNILQDPTECHDVAGKHPDVLKDLESRLSAYREGLVPRNNNTYDRRANPTLFDDFWSPWIPSLGHTSRSSFLSLVVISLACFLYNR